MGYSTRHTKTADNMYFVDVRTAAYGAGYSVYKTPKYSTVQAAYADAKAWQDAKAAANKAAKASKDGARMTCQCCGKGWLANNGKIAHHGYQRPGDGWQTASCNGARALPFEVSRDALGHHIDMVRNYLARTELRLVEVKAEDGELAVTFTDYETKRDHRTGKHGNRTVFVTRDSFEAIRESISSFRSRQSFPSSFDVVKERAVNKLTRDISDTKVYINEQQARYDGWKGPTHAWDKTAKEWVAL